MHFAAFSRAHPLAGIGLAASSQSRRRACSACISSIFFFAGVGPSPTRSCNGLSCRCGPASTTRQGRILFPLRLPPIARAAIRAKDDNLTRFGGGHDWLLRSLSLLAAPSSALLVFLHLPSPWCACARQVGRGRGGTTAMWMTNHTENPDRNPSFFLHAGRHQRALSCLSPLTRSGFARFQTDTEPEGNAGSSLSSKENVTVNFFLLFFPPFFIISSRHGVRRIVVAAAGRGVITAAAYGAVAVHGRRRAHLARGH